MLGSRVLHHAGAARMAAGMRVFVRVRTHAYRTHACMHACMQACSPLPPLYTYVCCIHTYVPPFPDYIHMHVCVCICVWACPTLPPLYTYTHVHTHTTQVVCRMDDIRCRDRMCSLTIECVLLLHNTGGLQDGGRHPLPYAPLGCVCVCVCVYAPVRLCVHRS